MIDGACVTAWKGKAETEKEKRETAALTRKCSDSFAPAWYGSGWVWASMHCGIGNRWKRKIIGTARKSHCIPCISRGWFLCMDFIQLQSKNHDERNVENLNDPHFKRIAKPILFVACYRNIQVQCSLHQLSIVQYMLQPRVNAQASVRRTVQTTLKPRNGLDPPPGKF